MNVTGPAELNGGSGGPSRRPNPKRRSMPSPAWSILLLAGSALSN